MKTLSTKRTFFFGSQPSHQGIFAVLYGLTEVQMLLLAAPDAGTAAPGDCGSSLEGVNSWVVFGELGTGCILKMMMSVCSPKNGDIFCWLFFCGNLIDILFDGLFFLRWGLGCYPVPWLGDLLFFLEIDVVLLCSSIKLVESIGWALPCWWCIPTKR